MRNVGQASYPPRDDTLTVVRVSRGGTGATTAAAARTNLGAAAAAHTHPLGDLTQSGATTGQVATWNGTAWAPQTPAGGGGYDPEFRNEVICPCTVVANSYVNMIARTESGGTGAVVAGAGAAALGEALFRDSNGGAVMLSSGTTATGRAHCIYANASGAHTFRYFRPSVGAPWNAGFVVIGTHRPDATEDFVFRIGFQFIASIADPNDPMAQFVVDRTLNNGDTWHVQARATTGGARTTVNTGVGVNRSSDASPAWNRMRLIWRVSPAELEWWIDGVSGTITTNVPDAMLGCGVNIVKIAGTTDRRLFWCDGRMWQPRATRKW